jgi:predicted nuclease of predicted toxin-antitoxin system
MRFAADENFDGRILDALRSRLPDLDIVRVQDTPMYQEPDKVLLAWLADEERILLTHDVRTMPRFVFERVRAGLPVPGVIEVRKEDASIGTLVDDLEIAIGAGRPQDFENQVKYIPMR